MLDGDSLDRLEIVLALEELTGLDLPEVMVSTGRDTVGDIAEALSNIWARAQARSNRFADHNRT